MAGYRVEESQRKEFFSSLLVAIVISGHHGLPPVWRTSHSLRILRPVLSANPL